MIEFIKNIQRKNIARSLNKKQGLVDKLYMEEGLSDKVLSMQMEINCQRHLNDIPDPTEKLFEDYVQ